MSVEVISWVLNEAPVQSPVSKFVLVALANHAHPDGTAAFPSVKTICRYTCLSERSVRQHLDNLEAQGIIKRCDQRIVAAYIDRSDRRPVGYDIVMSGVQEMQVEGERGAGDSPNGVQEIPERGAGGAPKPSNKPSIKPSEVAALVQEFKKVIADTTPEGVASPAVSTQWHKALQALLTVHGASSTQIISVMRSAASDAFWRKNIRTPMALEKHWERLNIEIGQAKPVVSTSRRDIGLDDGKTMVLNFVRLKKDDSEIAEYIAGRPASHHDALHQWWKENRSA
jgi:hypothetical protein